MEETSKKTYHITTFGCQMNISDSERVAAVAESLGLINVDSIEKADLIIINSCSIRQKAEDRVIGMGKKINQLKKSKPDLVTVLTGCMAKREDRSSNYKTAITENIDNPESYEKSLKKLMPWLDNIIQIKDIHKLNSIYGKTEAKIQEYLSITPNTKNSFMQWIPISTGCNKFCTFCIVPFSRGREIYRPYEEILHDIERAVNNGAKEITLLGQNVNSWRGFKDSNDYIESQDPHRLLKKDLPVNMIDFSDLLENIGIFLDNWMMENNSKVWLKFTSSHPYDIDSKLIDVVKRHPSIANQFHFALQSGSNSVLKRMNRHYTAEDFIKKCKLIRASIPQVGISTDIIVGFCEETNEEFQQTAKVMQEIKFDQAFIAEYSNRKGTIASKIYKDNIENKIKSERKEILNNILSKGNLERNSKMVGLKETVLVYKKNKLGFIARTQNNKDVAIEFSDNIRLGEFYTVDILKATDWNLFGKLIYI